MTKQDVKMDPKTELVEPSGEVHMEVDIGEIEVASEEVRPVSEIINKEDFVGNVGDAIREQTRDDLSDKGLENGNADGNEIEKTQFSVVTDGGFSNKMECDGDQSNVKEENVEEIMGTKEIGTLFGDNNVNVGNLDFTEGACVDNLVDMKENEMKKEKNLPGTDDDVGNGEQKVHVMDVKLEGNQVRESVNPEEKQMISKEVIGDTSLEILVKPNEEQTGVTQAEPVEDHIGDALENSKELCASGVLEISEGNKIGDTSIEQVDNKMENASVKAELNQIRDASVYSKENQTEDISVISEWNKIGEVALELENYEKKQLEDTPQTPVKSQMKDMVDGECPVNTESSNLSIVCYSQVAGGDDSGTEEEQAAFMKELENFYKEKNLEFKAPKFYGEGLNCLKLWRAVTKLGGYEQVTSCKLWRQVGESFKPPKTCTTISWSFRCFYEKALLEYEKHKITTGELQVPVSAPQEAVSVENQVGNTHVSGSGRARRDSAARAMQGWHSQRLLGNGEVSEPIIKDKSSISFLKRDKQHRSGGGIFKRKKPSTFDHPNKAARLDIDKTQMDTMVVDCGPAADWVKINVRRTRDCFEVYALVPGLLREEVHVQSDAAGRLVISGEPEQPDNPWGVTPFRKIVTLPSRIDAHQTSAIVTLHGQLFVRAPFEQQE